VTNESNPAGVSLEDWASRGVMADSLLLDAINYLGRKRVIFRARRVLNQNEANPEARVGCQRTTQS
jgi:hypothetical protein